MRDCWFCEESVSTGGAVSCSSCYAVFHKECWLGSKGCPRLDCHSIKAFSGPSTKLRLPTETKAPKALKTFKLKVAYLRFLERMLTFDDESGWISCQYQWRATGKTMWTNERWLPDHAIKYIVQKSKAITVFGRNHNELFTTREVELSKAIALFAECTILSDSHEQTS